AGLLAPASFAPVFAVPAPVFAAVPPPVFAVPLPVFAVVPEVAAGGFLSASLGVDCAAALAATSNEDSATTVEVARMRTLQPALAGFIRVRAGGKPALFPVECSSCSIGIL